MRAATLKIDGRTDVEIASLDELNAALGQLEGLTERQSVLLARSPKHFILAQRHGRLWSAETRNGPFWTLASFNGVGTSDYSAMRARQYRKATGFLEWLGVLFTAPSQSQSLSTQDVKIILREFLAEEKFSKPFLGA